MKLSDIKEILNAKVLTGKTLDKEVNSVFAADLMSDVLTFAQTRTLLLTGLTNIQVLRTAEIMDIFAIVFVRGKCPGQDVIKLAEKDGLVLLETDQIMYTSCGLLYENGLK